MKSTNFYKLKKEANDCDIFCTLYDCVSNVNVLLIQPHGCQNVINVI